MVKFDEKAMKRAMKKAERREWFQERVKRMKYWLWNNKDMIIFFGPMVIGGVATLFRVGSKHLALHKEKKLKDLYCYDRSLGHYWRLRRELKNHEWVQIDKRKANGERLADILAEMRVLK